MKGILRILTSRKIAAAINIFVQFVVIFLLVAYFENAFVYYYAITAALAIACCVYIINKNMNSGYKLAWLLLLLLLPMFGFTLFIMLEGSWYTKRTKRKMLTITERIKDGLLQRDDVAFEDSFAEKQSKYIEDFAYSPPKYQKGY